MPTIDNPLSFESPYASSLSTLARAFMSGPTEAQKIVQAETALKLQRERQGIQDLATAFTNYGTPAYNPNTAAAAVIRGGYDPEKFAVLQRGYNANTYGAQDPRTTNSFVGAGGDYGNTYAGFNTAQAGLNSRAKMAADRQAATQTAIDERTPIAVQQPDGSLAYYTKKEAAAGHMAAPITADQAKGIVLQRALRGVASGAPGTPPAPLQNLGLASAGIDVPSIAPAPVQPTPAPGAVSFDPLMNLPPGVARLLGVEPKNPPTPHMWVDPDGTRHPTVNMQTDALTGQPLKPGGTLVQVQGTPDQVGMSVANKAQESNLAFERLKEGTNFALGLIKPTNTGVPGYIKSWAQDAAQVASGISDAFGYHQPADMLRDLQQRAQANGVDGKVLASLFTFDQTLPQLQTAYYALAMNAADAIAGGVGKASDKDMRAVVGMLGSPNELFANPDYLKSKIAAITDYANRMQAVNARFLRGGQGSAAAPAAPAGAPVPAPPSSAGAPQSSPVVRTYNPATGRIE